MKAGWAASAAVAVLVAAGAHASAAAEPVGAMAAKPADEMSAQQRRARTRIQVRPQRYRSPPGPDYVRQCVAWLQPENRPSGRVITPQMRCWWERG